MARFASLEYATELLDETEDRLGKNVAPISLLSADTRGDYLGVPRAVVMFFQRASTSEVLREALERLGSDRSFDFKYEDEQFQALDDQIGDVDFLLAGHTHLARVIDRKRGRGTYFNSGAWVRLMRFDKATLGHPAAFDAVFTAIKAGTMKALDDHPGLIMRFPTVVAIWTEHAQVCAELRRAGLSPADPVMTALPGTRVNG
jgi:hypothetical protein